MKLIRRYHNPHLGYDVETAVQIVLDTNPLSEGALEEMRSRIERHTQMTSKLVGLLHEAGVITDEQVLSLIPEFEEAPNDQT